MTELDQKLVEAARLVHYAHYRDIDSLMRVATSEEGREKLSTIQDILRAVYYDRTEG